MRKLLFSIFMLAGLQAFSQAPTLKYSNYFVLQNTVRISGADSNGVVPGAGGANTSWSFPNLHHTIGSTTLGSCASNQTSNIFPNAQLQLVTSGGNFMYFTGDGSNIIDYGTKIGYGQGEIYHIYNSSPITLWAFPITYNSTSTSNFSGTIAYMDAANSTTFWSGSSSGTYTYTADGYGTLKVMNTTIKNTLRLKVHSVTKDSVVISGKSVKTVTDQTDYVWMASGIKNSLLKISLIKVTTNGKDSISKEVNYNIDDSLSSIQNANALATNLNLYPNPTSGQFRINFEALENGNADICIMNQLGQTIKLIPQQTYRMGMNNVDINLDGVAKGIYFVRLSNGDKSSVSKLSVE